LFIRISTTWSGC